MQPFEYNANPGRVIFGSSTVKKLPDELSRLNVSAPLLLSTPQQLSQVELLKDALSGKKLADALPSSDGDAVKGLNVLLGKLQVKRGLKEFGMKEEDVDEAAEIAVSNPYWNPRSIEKDGIRELIRRAWAGEDARADL